VKFILGISLPIYNTGINSGLIVDVGFGETRGEISCPKDGSPFPSLVLPVMDGFPILSALKAAPV